MNASFLFEAASKAEAIARRVKKTQIGRQVWNDDIHNSLIEIFLCPEPFSPALAGDIMEAEGEDAVDAFSQEILPKMETFLANVRKKVEGLTMDYQTRRTFYSKIVNVLLNSLGVSITGPKLGDLAIKGVGEKFARRLNKEDPEAMAYVRNRINFHKSRGMGEREAWDMAKKDYEGQYNDAGERVGNVPSTLKNLNPSEDELFTQAQKVVHKVLSQNPGMANDNDFKSKVANMLARANFALTKAGKPSVGNAAMKSIMAKLFPQVN